MLLIEIFFVSLAIKQDTRGKDKRVVVRHYVCPGIRAECGTVYERRREESLSRRDVGRTNPVRYIEPSSELLSLFLMPPLIVFSQLTR